MKQKFFELKLKTNGQKLYNFTDKTISWINKNSFNNGRVLVVNFKEGKIEKTLKLDNNKLQRPVYFNKSLYIAKDNSIIRLN